MAVKASVTITISKYRDTDSITRYYKLQASTAAAPAVPTTLTPSGWSTSEPTYTSGSTNTLYYTDCIVFSDGTFQYTDDGNGKAVKSSSYEAAKEAYNKAQAAQDSIDNLNIGGRNLILQSKESINSLQYLVKRYTLSEDWEVGYTYTITIKGNVTNGKFGAWRDNGSRMITDNIPYDNEKDLYIKTFTCPEPWTTPSTVNNIISIYNTPSNVDHNSSIEWIKLEKGDKSTDWTPAPEDVEDQIDNLNNDLTYFKETTFTSYKRDQEENDRGIKNRLSRTEVTVYGDPSDPDDPEALINHIQKVDNDINGSGGLDDRLEAAEDTIDGTGLNDYDQRVKISQRFLNVETDVESIKNIFKITGGTNLVQNSVGYFADNDSKPTMWNIAANTIYTPFGYDADLTGITVSRGRLFCAKGSVITTSNNIVALLANKMMSISFKYKNGADATSKIKIFNGSVVYFEKTFNTAVDQWTEYTFNPDTDPVLANPSFLNTANSLQISIESTNSTNNNGFEISDLMLNYGDIKPWELSSNEVYGAMVKLSSLGIEVTATTAKTKNFMTTDGILVYEYNPQTETIGNLITKITDNGTVTNRLESTGDIIERNLIHTMIKDSSNNNVYVEYIR